MWLEIDSPSWLVILQILGAFCDRSVPPAQAALSQLVGQSLPWDSGPGLQIKEKEVLDWGIYAAQNSEKSFDSWAGLSS